MLPNIIPLICTVKFDNTLFVQSKSEGYGSPVVKVLDHGRHVMSSSPVPLKIRRVGQRFMLKLSRAETFSCGAVW
ncbi:hypothetical protein TNCV_1427521 [Trichonephila clavipes]|nr:hypothetical protein TNCV_1427521 [Trichonephila clavipes]